MRRSQIFRVFGCLIKGNGLPGIQMLQESIEAGVVVRINGYGHWWLDVQMTLEGYHRRNILAALREKVAVRA